MLARSNRSVAYSSVPTIPEAEPSAARVSRSESDKSNFELAVDTASNDAATPSSSNSTAALFWNASITWNSGCRDSDRAGLTTSTNRSNGTSWWL